MPGIYKSGNRFCRDFRGIELNGQSLEIVEKFSYLDETIKTGGGAFGSVVTRISSEW